MALSFPAAPVNGQTYAAPNGVTYTFNSTTGAWTAATAGGGGGTVTTVSGTLPITVATGTTTPVIAINAATAAAAGSIEIATLAEAAAGTDATRALTPESGVPKDASGMTGAALIPGGNDASRPGTPTAGMLRYNNQGGTPVAVEYYDGAAWTGLATGGGNGTVWGGGGYNDTGSAPGQTFGQVTSVSASFGSWDIFFTALPRPGVITGTASFGSASADESDNITVFQALVPAGTTSTTITSRRANGTTGTRPFGFIIVVS